MPTRYLNITPSSDRNLLFAVTQLYNEMPLPMEHNICMWRGHNKYPENLKLSRFQSRNFHSKLCPAYTTGFPPRFFSLVKTQLLPSTVVPGYNPSTTEAKAEVIQSSRPAWATQCDIFKKKKKSIVMSILLFLSSLNNIQVKRGVANILRQIR